MVIVDVDRDQRLNYSTLPFSSVRRIRHTIRWSLWNKSAVLWTSHAERVILSLLDSLRSLSFALVFLVFFLLIWQTKHKMVFNRKLNLYHQESVLFYRRAFDCLFLLNLSANQQRVLRHSWLNSLNSQPMSFYFCVVILCLTYNIHKYAVWEFIPLIIKSFGILTLELFTDMISFKSTTWSST